MARMARMVNPGDGDPGPVTTTPRRLSGFRCSAPCELPGAAPLREEVAAEVAVAVIPGAMLAAAEVVSGQVHVVPVAGVSRN